MDDKKYSEQCDDVLTFYPFTWHDGRYFTNNPPFLKDPAGRLKAIEEFDSYESDVILASCFKTGTHWVHEIVSMLLMQDTGYNKGGLIMDRNFEAFLDFDKANDLPKPRLFHTHMSFKYLPRKHVEKGYKIIHVNRNPKAKHVSMYCFMEGKTGVPPDWTWSDYFELFAMGKGLSVPEDSSKSQNKQKDADYSVFPLNDINGNMYGISGKVILPDEMPEKGDAYGGWFQYTKEWEDAIKKYPDSIYPVHYEWFKSDTFGTVKNLADFLKVKYTDEFLREIIDKCSFENLKEHKIDASRCIHPEGKSTLYRKGEVDNWKNWFTVAQNERFDELYAKEMAGYDVEF